MPLPEREREPEFSDEDSVYDDYDPLFQEDDFDLSIIEQNRERTVVEEPRDVPEGEDAPLTSGKTQLRRSKRGLHRNKTIWDGNHQVNISQSDRLNLRKIKVGVINTAWIMPLTALNGPVSLPLVWNLTFHPMPNPLL